MKRGVLLPLAVCLPWAAAAVAQSAPDEATGRAGTVTVTQTWEYNALGLVSHHSHPRPDGAAPFVVSTGYDAGLPVTQYVNGVPVVTAVRYHPDGSLAGYTTGIGIGHDVTATIGHDASSLLPRPTRIRAAAQGSPLPAFDTSDYAYDGAGNVAAMGPDTFSYDARSRLVNASLAGAGIQTYEYDRYANLVRKSGNTFCSGACTNNRISGATYERGNLTAFAGQEFTYDGLDRMLSSTSSGLSWSYLYDGGDERIAKVPPVGSMSLTFRDEGKRVVSEYSGTTVSRDNVFLGSQLVAAYANAAVGGSGPVWSLYASDHLGTPRVVTDLAGATIETRRYWPYGDAVSTQGPFESLRFATMEFDAEGGTAGGLASDRYYDHARSHVGGLARFLTPDRVGGRIEDPQTWNRYAYSRDNPLRFVDSTGLEFGYPGQQQELDRVIAAQFRNRLATGQLTETIGPVNTVILGVSGAGPAVNLLSRTISVVQGAENAPAAKPSQEMNPATSPNFVVTENGEAIPIPDGAAGPTSPRAGSGQVYEGGSGGPGMDSRTTGVRIMDANRTQGPRVNYMNREGQTVDPATGRTISKSDPRGHIPLRPSNPDSAKAPCTSADPACPVPK